MSLDFYDNTTKILKDVAGIIMKQKLSM